jgi:hypothetical protein
MSKVLDKKYIDDHFRGETRSIMTYLHTSALPVTTNLIAEDTGVPRSNVASRLCAMRAAGAITSTINPDYRPGMLQRNLWAINPTIPTRYKKRTKVKAKVKTKAEVEAIRAKLRAKEQLDTAINAWGADYEAYKKAGKPTKTAEPRVVEVPIKPNPTKGKIGVLLDLINVWKVPYVEATEILHILTKREE